MLTTLVVPCAEQKTLGLCAEQRLGAGHGGRERGEAGEDGSVSGAGRGLMRR